MRRTRPVSGHDWREEMKAARLLFLLLLFSLIAGCQSVASHFPVGEADAVINPEAWTGRWLPIPPDEESAEVEIQVLDSEKGFIRISWIEPGDGQLQSRNCLLRGSGDWMFANISESAGVEYYWGRIKNEKGRMLLVWLPDYDKFKMLVENGVLPGETRDSTVYLGRLRPEHLKIIRSGEFGTLFRWDEPVVLMKVQTPPAGGK
jgi:hypothetical protein